MSEIYVQSVGVFFVCLKNLQCLANSQHVPVGLLDTEISIIASRVILFQNFDQSKRGGWRRCPAWVICILRVTFLLFQACTNIFGVTRPLQSRAFKTQGKCYFVIVLTEIKRTSINVVVAMYIGQRGGARWSCVCPLWDTILSLPLQVRRNFGVCPHLYFHTCLFLAQLVVIC